MKIMLSLFFAGKQKVPVMNYNVLCDTQLSGGLFDPTKKLKKTSHVSAEIITPTTKTNFLATSSAGTSLFRWFKWFIEVTTATYGTEDHHFHIL